MKDAEQAIGKKIIPSRGEMLFFTKIKDLTFYLNTPENHNKTIGFIPTMGALHEGHMSLITKAKKENDLIVVSIFVNPTQFNNPDDLKNYPRTPKEDFDLLNKNNVDVIFSPDVNEIYGATTDTEKLKLPGIITDVMEGVHRPGHFDGVVQIVSKLFDIVRPQRAYFGEKDFQQLAIVKAIVKSMGINTIVVGCPTVREKNGLAMSSRNQKLSADGLNHASEISKALYYVQNNWKKFNPQEAIKNAIGMIEKDGKLKVEYLEIADEETLLKVNDWQDHNHVRCFAAVYCEGVRLIDNVSIF